MNINRTPASLTTAITMLLALPVLTLIGAPGHHLASPLRSPITLEAAAYVTATSSDSARACRVPVAAQDGHERNQPPLSYNQALRLIRTVTPGLVDITATLPSGAKAGTGIVLTANGRVLTADHVVSHAIALSVRDLGNGLDYAARIVGTDPFHDLAVLQLDGATQLHTVHLGGRVAIGEMVASIGNAGGRGQPSLGAGPVVALRQRITSTTGQNQPLTGLIEACNGVEPGESGGPLVTADGLVVGLTVATQLSDDGTPNGHGYAVPIATAMRAVRWILENT